MRALHTSQPHINRLGKLQGVWNHDKTEFNQNIFNTHTSSKVEVTMFPLLFDPGAVRSSTLLQYWNSKSFNTRINMPIDIFFYKTVFLGAGVIKYYECRHCLSPPLDSFFWFMYSKERVTVSLKVAWERKGEHLNVTKWNFSLLKSDTFVLQNITRRVLRNQGQIQPMGKN